MTLPAKKFNGSDLVRSTLKGPAYAQLAQSIKSKIASGEYPAGARIPAETVIGRSYGVALMTVRQAVKVLVEQGLLRRLHGVGTFVCGPDWTKASFEMTGLLEFLRDRDNLDIRILSAGVEEAGEAGAAALGVAPEDLIVVLLRLVSRRGRPFLLNRARLIFDPKSPIVESELEVSSLYGLFSGQGNSYIKKASLGLDPAVPSPSEAERLGASASAPAFRISYTFFGYDDEPVGSGWFLIPSEVMSFSAKIGVWGDEE
ncbi:MAG: GntR family transcriptional regulator [Deltaproteobacteria bacterium]|jgi:GntR family transcriptional regulator|nr:GntR family transcriptional regulator [Deltaproteobacteria bacterium]